MAAAGNDLERSIYTRTTMAVAGESGKVQAGEQSKVQRGRQTQTYSIGGSEGGEEGNYFDDGPEHE